MSSPVKVAAAADLASVRLLRVSEVAERLAISPSMAWKMINLGQLRALHIGRAVRIRPQDLEEYVAGAVREG